MAGNNTILVTGGCGYIGSHTVVDLLQNGFEVVCIDNNSNSKIEVAAAIEQIAGKAFVNYTTDLCDYHATRAVFEKHAFAGIIHFAAFKSVPESVAFPMKYYYNNVNSLTNLMRLTEEFGIRNFVFSSSCSVYGNTTELPVTEDTALAGAESPYAHTKQIGEDMIRGFTRVNQKHNYILLRYFNPAGAHSSGLIGEDATGTITAVVPRITGTAIGKFAKFYVFGADYDTKDGTCVRDYIHVMDIANAHTKALQYLLEGRNEASCEVFNLGTGNGVSVLETIQSFERVSGNKLNYELSPRRDGDVVAIYANNEKAKTRLGWQITKSLDDMLLTAWNWENVLAKRK
jgi:UDP-glucose 4-epimerase